ncbi:HAMP domain-containing sensor histidine kinase [Clostridium sp.]|uniref:sensor histidine kinase n=1 Tax=Clostridium sp. TaxID=1506 RepID=UPI002607DB3A|nr:HAMP domain-containing sensor histidine kinase [Clostridium sp.]
MLKIKCNLQDKIKEICIFLIIIIISFILKKVFDSKSEIIFISKLISLCISIIIYIISRIKINDKRMNNIKYIGVAFLYISIGRFFDLENISGIYINKINVDFFQLISYLEFINVMVAFISFKFKISTKVQHIVYNIILIILFNLNKQESLLYIQDENIIYLTTFIIKIILIIIYFKLIIKNNEKLSCKKEVYLIWGEMLLITLIIEFITNLFNTDLFLLIQFIKVYMYIKIYNKLETVIYSIAYEKAELDLNKNLKRKIEKNKKLKLREKELFELNKNLEKSEEIYYNLLKTFYDVIIIFDKDEIIFKNYFNLYEEYNFKKTYNNLNLDFVLQMIFEDKYNDIKGKEEFYIIIEKKDENFKKYILEIELKKIYDSKKILSINDITEIVKKKEEIIKLKNKINEEKIKDEFYANISHELRTPINVIYSGLQLNSIYIENKEIEKIKGNNKLIKQNCLRLIRTINNFIDSNKLSENKIIFNNKVCNIVSVIDNIVLCCDYYMRQRNIKVTFDPEFEEIYILCDKNHIERIMLNILSNSLKYGKEFGNIFLTLLIEDEKIIIEVMNDAEAIEESKRKMIFEKFTKINNSLSRPSEGSGLGLFLTKGLVELSKGSIEIISGKEIGNIFRVTLPYDKNIIKDENLIDKEFKINELKEKIDIEFSDIYL